MKKYFVIALLLLGVALVSADTINVTYRINMSSLGGFGVTDSTHLVQICGAEVGPEGEDLWQNNYLTWGDDSPQAVNVGGDYWELTIEYPDTYEGWRMAYKIRYKSHMEDEFNWESIGDNRMWVMPGQDTVLNVAYVNSFDPPFEVKDDTVCVYLRINFAAFDNFNPEVHEPSIVGHISEWAPGKYKLTREGNSRFYNIALYYSQEYIDGTGDQKFDGGWGDEWFGLHMYRYSYDGDTWDNTENLNGKYFPGNENRTLIFHPDMTDTTIAWVWWNDVPTAVVDHQDTMVVSFQADLSKAIQNRGFAPGDTLIVYHGYYGTAASVRNIRMERQGFSMIWAATDTVIGTAGEKLNYQYYALKNNEEFREIFYNYFYDGDTAGEQERRGYEDIADGAVIQDIEDSQTEMRRMPIFRNTEVLSKEVLVTFTVDLRPAYYTVLLGNELEDIQGNLNIVDAEDVFELGVAMNGPATGGWGQWGPGLMEAERKMFDDGTHGDAVAGDSIYTIQFVYHPDSTNNRVGQEFKFGIGGGDNEGGKGGYGLNHIENIDDTESTYTIASQFGSLNPAYYIGWNYDDQTSTSVEMIDTNPREFALEQNYPNPFNPVTTIRYSLASPERVTLRVFNITGRQIAMLVDQNQAAGTYSVTWNGLDNHGMHAASGVYFYVIEAGSFKQTQKMIFMK